MSKKQGERMIECAMCDRGNNGEITIDQALLFGWNDIHAVSDTELFNDYSGRCVECQLEEAAVDLHAIKAKIWRLKKLIKLSKKAKP